MKNVLNLVLFTLAVTAFYTYVGHMVPQKESHPPVELQIRADMTQEEMIDMGKELASGKGTCLSCHTLGASGAGRFPDLAGIGSRAGSRKPGMSELDYLAESMYDPGAFIVPGFNPGMPPANKAPIGLSDAEILCVIAYLQSLGGTPTVTLQTKLKGQQP
jgi:mono/diheme cytochrome c family protein